MYNYYYRFICRVHVEAGISDFEAGTVPNGELYARMYSKSPVAHVARVQTPAMIMLGQDDHRVPPSQGIEFHKALKSRNVTSRYA